MLSYETRPGTVDSSSSSCSEMYFSTSAGAAPSNSVRTVMVG